MGLFSLLQVTLAVWLKVGLPWATLRRKGGGGGLWSLGTQGTAIRQLQPAVAMWVCGSSIAQSFSICCCVCVCFLFKGKLEILIFI